MDLVSSLPRRRGRRTELQAAIYQQPCLGVAEATGQATVTTYPLTFKPEWVCDVKAALGVARDLQAIRGLEAQLVLYNVGTNETYEPAPKRAELGSSLVLPESCWLRYDLHGVAEEPLAEEHVVVKLMTEHDLHLKGLNDVHGLWAQTC